MPPKHVIHLLSGGLDSTVLLYDLIHQGHQGCAVHCVLFDYGQRHGVELNYARKHCEATGTKHTLVELWRVKNLFLRCALTDGNGSNIVPNRNAIMLNIASALAVSAGAESVTIACNADDADMFHDCRPEFIAATNESLRAAGVPVEVCAPYLHLTKREIVGIAKRIGAPYLDTVSCYTGNDCGTCDACRKRNDAIA